MRLPRDGDRTANGGLRGQAREGGRQPAAGAGRENPGVGKCGKGRRGREQRYVCPARNTVDGFPDRLHCGLLLVLLNRCSLRRSVRVGAVVVADTSATTTVKDVTEGAGPVRAWKAKLDAADALLVRALQHPSQEGVVAGVSRQSPWRLSRPASPLSANAACARGSGGSGWSRRSTSRRTPRRRGEPRHRSCTASG